MEAVLVDDVPLSAWHGPSSTHGGREYGEMIVALRSFLASVAGARPDLASISRLTTDLESWSSRLQTMQVGEADQVYARRPDLVGRGQATWPALSFTRCTSDVLEARVRFDRFFLGRNGVVHGGVITLIFDEMAGRLAQVGDKGIARTAYLRTNFRKPTPIDTDLTIIARYDREEGRKSFLNITLHDGETLYAEADVLMVRLQAGQQ